ncbi:ATP-dependent helicase [Sulfuriroseicoccus oceanibius]|uniref:DNA 3'-5' helicase n=1 Tax=Sulfuriroseicoccus oceanibius TaxID=2707525 RepID=A0A6B3L9Y0_9BACT|nr:UvrD-helicase domain-containing protein [Sulfuriroseicoccus oceanibius]QQL43704.1 UvrD-helicase domain-containing protein [Sulfuriroseicoccus oceanibius]
MADKGFSLSQLNAPQREAVVTLKGPVLILAGAGTGKTRTITARIAHMMDQGIDPKTVLAVTFTNKAAVEMRERIDGMIPGGKAKDMTVCTFHSLCVRILRQSIERLGYKPKFAIYTQGEQTGLIRRLINKYAGKDENLDPNAAISMISAAKNKGQAVSDQNDSLIAEVYRAYEEEKRLLNAVDFDDLLVLAERVLRENPDVRDYWRSCYHYITVDEFQDTNKLQMQVVQHIVGKEANICVVGDDDQSIYGWRGAEISNILDFEQFFPNPKVILLEENYRSTTPILHTANSSIKFNTSRREKKLWSSNVSEEKIRLIAMPGDVEESEFIADEIFEIVQVEKRPFEDFAVIFRTNAQSRVIEEAMRERKIPYRVVGGQSFFDRREIKDYLAYLSVMLHPEDDINLLRIINTPARGISKTTIDLAIGDSRERKVTVWEILQDPEFVGQLGTRAQNSIAAFVELMQRYGNEADRPSANYGEIAERFLKEIDFDDFLERQCKTVEEADKRKEGIHSLTQDLYRHHGDPKKRERGLRGFLDDMALSSDRDDDEDISKQKGVCLITMHAAKGLEFPDVYLIGLEQGILPHKRSLVEDTVPEERRLFYVGVTRAMTRLTMSYCATRKKWNELITCEPSIFLTEVDKTYIEELSLDDIQGEPLDDEESEDAFANMMEMLEGIEGVELD